MNPLNIVYDWATLWLDANHDELIYFALVWSRS